MWFVMERLQESYSLSEKLLRTINDAGNVLPNSRPSVSSESSRSKTHRRLMSTISELVEDGAELNRLHGNMLPLHCASFTGDPTALSILIKSGADVNMLDGFFRSPLHYAVEQSLGCVTLLLSAGADPRITDRLGNTPLHWAAYRNHSDIARVLLEAGADPNAADHSGDTPLSLAAVKGSFETMKLLLMEYNSCPTTSNRNGKTPLSLLAGNIALTGIESAQDEAAFLLLIKAVGQIETDIGNYSLNQFFPLDEDLRQKMIAYSGSPRTLQQFCRVSVRRSLGPGYLPSKVLLLPIPDRIQKYVLLQ